MKKSLVCLATSLLMLFLAVLWTLVLLYYNQFSLPWQQTIDCPAFMVLSSKNIENVIKQSRLEDVTVILPDGEHKLTTKDFLDVQVSMNDQTVSDWLAGNPIDYAVKYNWNIDALHNSLKRLRSNSKNAHFGFERYADDELEHRVKLIIVPEVQGNDYDLYELTNLVVTNIVQCVFEIDAQPLCKKPLVTREVLSPWYDRIKWLDDVNIMYSKGYEVKIDGEYLFNKLSDDYTLNYETLDFSDILDEVCRHYNTHGSSLEFTDSSGEFRTVLYNTWGKFVDIDKETAALKELIQKRTVDYTRIPETYGHDKFEDTYLEVSISKQHIWHYRGGELCCESDIVTGRQYKHDTPTGLFYISERVPGKYLTGDGYRTWVNKWMRLTNQGVGLHDAGWRGRFGGSVYTYNGSHGCINLPSSYAYRLYDETYVGMPVIVY